MIRFYIWVTSNCNLSCRYCSQKYTMRQNAGYEMSREEVDAIVDSCLKRKIRFDDIDLTAGAYGIHWFNGHPLSQEYLRQPKPCSMTTILKREGYL